MKLRSLLLKLVLRMLQYYETELPKLQRENRKLKTKVKDLKVKEKKWRINE